ncbi:MetQ/NlpA family ABC transporter substrate-binding protein [Haematospirillum jordaniae]|uniref:MetQ/NlpA family ABC transporter substrate-binding protein n=1 Tax=Haematospirillum jordaniae TaxID=1549855 RepID=UPI0014334665|nr:MetQ/NlpA family ABC transporter substrate-binding protein [Haematospirillum jordaniae]NKD85211.1 MetQ/NlpA family ABC transporter substrate-binding protein [Haematospirillum jordaniae]
MRLYGVLAAAAVITGTLISLAQAKEIRIGVTPGSHEQVVEKVAELIKTKGHTLKIVTFSDYILPNQALANGDLDANSFQHVPYLEQQKKGLGVDLAVAGTNFVEPMGVYARTVRSLSDLKEGAKVAIPNDPSNGGRALLLLAAKGVITVNPSAGMTPGAADVTGNPKKLKFIELDAAQLPRSLDDVDIAAINTNYALEAGLNPLKDAIVIEDASSPYANIVVVRSKDKDEGWVKDLVAAYQAEDIRTFIQDTFKGAIVPAF